MIFAMTEHELAPDILDLLTDVDPDALEVVLLDQPQAECPVTHHFGPDVYIREVFIPAGSIVVGHAHKGENLNIMLKGRMALLVDGQVSIVEAPFMKVASPGRKVAVAIEDTVWQNVYATNETDIDKLDAMFVEKSPAWLAHHNVGAIT